MTLIVGSYGGKPPAPYPDPLEMPVVSLPDGEVQIIDPTPSPPDTRFSDSLTTTQPDGRLVDGFDFGSWLQGYMEGTAAVDAEGRMRLFARLDATEKALQLAMAMIVELRDGTNTVAGTLGVVVGRMMNTPLGSNDMVVYQEGAD